MGKLFSEKLFPESFCRKRIKIIRAWSICLLQALPFAGTALCRQFAPAFFHSQGQFLLLLSRICCLTIGGFPKWPSLNLWHSVATRTSTEPYAYGMHRKSCCIQSSSLESSGSDLTKGTPSNAIASNSSKVDSIRQ